jgi:hypothetical protein
MSLLLVLFDGLLCAGRGQRGRVLCGREQPRADAFSQAAGNRARAARGGRVAAAAEPETGQGGDGGLID